MVASNGCIKVPTQYCFPGNQLNDGIYPLFQDNVKRLTKTAFKDFFIHVNLQAILYTKGTLVQSPLYMTGVFREEYLYIKYTI